MSSFIAPTTSCEMPDESSLSCGSGSDETYAEIDCDSAASRCATSLCSLASSARSACASALSSSMYLEASISISSPLSSSTWTLPSSWGVKAAGASASGAAGSAALASSGACASRSLMSAPSAVANSSHEICPSESVSKRRIIVSTSKAGGSSPSYTSRSSASTSATSMKPDPLRSSLSNALRYSAAERVRSPSSWRSVTTYSALRSM
mmetsp:Transcript_38991/g.107576  ORF Transcript_38991/g.107576 Transcript_38991/m.107576 type:complete len:208 (-) Transcript_38991:109-732(-)